MSILASRRSCDMLERYQLLAVGSWLLAVGYQLSALGCRSIGRGVPISIEYYQTVILRAESLELRGFVPERSFPESSKVILSTSIR